jgi:hypothetical protein
MTAPIFFLSAAVAGVLVLVLTWRKAGIGRTLLAAAIAMGAGVGVAMAAVAQQTGQDISYAFAPGELLAAFTGVFIAASWSNRRYHALKLQQEQAQKKA